MTRFFQFKCITIASCLILLLGACDSDDADSPTGDVATDTPADTRQLPDDGGPRLVPDAVSGASCANDDDCPEGRLCDPYRTVCTPECTTQQDCPAWIYCVLRPGRGGRICTPRPPGDIYSIEFAGDTCAAGAARCERSAPIDSTLSLTARVRAGNATVSNATVIFEVAASGGTDAAITTRSVDTNDQGIATTQLQTGAAQGIADVQAALAGGNPLTWKVTISSQ